MKPTNQFRWLKRKSWKSMIGPSDGYGNVLVLQQWWENADRKYLEEYGEWRDVPIEDEK